MSDPIVSGAPQGTPAVAGDPRLVELLNHADDNLILSQRLGEWISNAPELELDIALGNIALDHLGVARALYTHAGFIEGRGRTEDDFAMARSEREFTNLLLVEQPNGDFANTIVRQFFFDAYQMLLWPELATATDEVVTGVAAKAMKENDYHFRFSSGWVARLGDGTDESNQRMQQAVDALWPFTAELTAGTGFERRWQVVVEGALTSAGLSTPQDPYQKSGGRTGFHTEHMGFILAEMQWMQRSYPGVSW